MLHLLALELEYPDVARVDKPGQPPGHGLDGHHDTADLDAAAGASGAHAPTNISSTRMTREKSGHRLKSAVEKPVVVMMEATWKAV